MMEVSLTIDGPSQQLLNRIELAADNARQAIRQTFFEVGRHLKQKTSKDILDKRSKTGRIYIVRTRTGRKRKHRASAPYQTHANLSGDLRKSLGWKVYGTDKMEFGYGVTRYVGDASSYARRIEEGGTDSRGITIEPRPSLKNNIENVNFETFFYDQVSKLVG